jgi:group I intron endonuclease
MGIIYKTTNKINGKFYVGKDAQGIRKWYYGSGDIIKRAIAKYGKENFRKEILEECDNSILDEREIWWIKELRARELGYNITEGGNTPPSRKGATLSDETKAKLSKSRTGKGCGPRDDVWRRNISNGKKGVLFSDEHKAHLSDKRRSRFITDATRQKTSATSKGHINIKKYRVTDPNGKQYITERGLVCFCEEHNLTRPLMSKVAYGERDHHKGWKCELLKEDGKL